jgi:DASS family divalent anion:Na+ symporter
VGIAEGEGGEDIRDQLSTEFVDETSVVKGRIHRVLRLWPAVLVCVIIWCLPVPDLLSPASMRLLGVFAGVITALLTTEFEISFLIAIALTILTLTRSFACRTADGSWIPCGNCEPNGLDPVRCKGFEGAFDSALLGYSSEVNWLVFCAFHLGQAVQVSGLGRRIALHLVRLFGKSLFGLGYALFLAGKC